MLAEKIYLLISGLPDNFKSVLKINKQTLETTFCMHVCDWVVMNNISNDENAILFANVAR